jgi:hypothetical protein
MALLYSIDEWTKLYKQLQTTAEKVCSQYDTQHYAETNDLRECEKLLHELLKIQYIHVIKFEAIVAIVEDIVSNKNLLSFFTIEQTQQGVLKFTTNLISSKLRTMYDN